MTPINKTQALTLKKEVDRSFGWKSRKATKPTRIFQLGDGVVHELIEVENGDLAITGIKDNNIRIFDSITGRLKKVLYGHEDYVMGMVNISNKNLLVSYSWDKSIKLWDTRNGYTMVKNYVRAGMILSLHIIQPDMFLLQESQSTSFFVPSKVTELVSIKNGASIKKFAKSTNLGKCLWVLNKSKLVVFTKHGEANVKFCAFKNKNFETISELRAKYTVNQWYELDDTKVVASFRDVGVYVVWDFVKQEEVYSLCPHNNEILDIWIRQYRVFDCDKPSQVVEQFPVDFSSVMEEEEKAQNQMNQNLAEKIEELSDKNLNKVIISAGRDRNIIISDPIKMRKLGQITLTNCSNEGYRFTGLRRKEEVWVWTLNGYIYVYDLNDVVKSHSI